MSQWWLIVLGIAAGFVAFGRPRPLTPVPILSAESVRIVIPARNEASSIGNLLTDLGQSVGPLWDVVVVDDGSTDGTSNIVGTFDFVRLITAPEPPPGWRGKPWACAIGASDTAASCDVLVFLDADVRLSPGAIDAVLATRRRAGGVLSVQPFHVAPTAVEELSAVFNLVSLMGVGAGTTRPRAIFGPVICCATSDYERVGGHVAVKSAVAEDVELGHAFIRAGVPLDVMTGGELVAFRMYPDGFRSLVEGWSKNMAIGAASVPWWRTLGVALWVTGLVQASLLCVTSWGHTSPLSAAALYASTALTLRFLLRQVGSFRWWVSLAFPIVTVVFVAVFARSVWLTHVRRAVTWRGRAIDLRPVESTVGSDPIAEAK